MIFHELCHWIVAGELALQSRDWGMDNTTDDDFHIEYACQRVQALIAGRHGLRRLLAPTTDFRSYYDALPPDPLEPRHDPISQLAVLAIQRADRAPWQPHLDRALQATAEIVSVAARFAPADGELPSLLETATSAPAPHPSGLPASPVVDPERRCETCSWSDVSATASTAKAASSVTGPAANAGRANTIVSSAAPAAGQPMDR